MPDPDLQPILSVRDLSVAFRVDNVWRPAVEDLSFDVGARQTVAIVGESGSGKSVTALSVMREAIEKLSYPTSAVGRIAA